jgi:hypothetical protein
MKKIIYFFVLSFTTISFYSCEKEIKVDIPYDGDKLVINSLFFADSLVYCQISKSQIITRNASITLINNANVQLFENGTLLQTMNPVQINNVNWYASTYKAKAGFQYTIKANAPGLATAEGTDSVPTIPNATLTSRTVLSSSSNADYTHNLKVKIADPGGQENYYKIAIFDADTVLSPIGPRYKILNYYNYYFRPNLIQNSGNADPFSNDNDTDELFLTDETFDGRELTLSLDYRERPINSANGNRLVVIVTKLSKSTYRYLTSLNNQSLNQGNPFAEASIVYNNIKNGFGIVGAANQVYVGSRKN